MTQFEYYISHSCEGYRAKVTVEWSITDEKDSLHMDKAEEIADNAITSIAAVPRLIVQVMRGFSK